PATLARRYGSRVTGRMSEDRCGERAFPVADRINAPIFPAIDVVSERTESKIEVGMLAQDGALTDRLRGVCHRCCRLGCGFGGMALGADLSTHIIGETKRTLVRSPGRRREFVRFCPLRKKGSKTVRSKWKRNSHAYRSQNDSTGQGHFSP